MNKKLSKEGDMLRSVQKSLESNENLSLLNNNEFKVWVSQLRIYEVHRLKLRYT